MSKNRKNESKLEPRTVAPVPGRVTFNEALAREELIAYCESLGLVWNEGNWQYFLPTITRLGYTHEQVVEGVKAHITLVAHLFNPKAYGWRGRLLIALHFVFNFKRPKKPTA